MGYIKFQDISNLSKEKRAQVESEEAAACADFCKRRIQDELLLANSAAKLSRDSGLTASEISYIKAGKKSVPIKSIGYLSSYILGTSVNDVLFGEPRPVRLPRYLSSVIVRFLELDIPTRKVVLQDVMQTFRDDISSPPKELPDGHIVRRLCEIADDMYRNVESVYGGKHSFKSEKNPRPATANTRRVFDGLLIQDRTPNMESMIKVLLNLDVSADYLLTVDYTASGDVEYFNGEEWELLTGAVPLGLVRAFLLITPAKQNDLFGYVVKTIYNIKHIEQ